ncbi:hypothetical protein JXA32_17650 [Candidatus Sumerlaeota bacterium]|nr:hypothetical protein [Candidatus Sumerlaeota bacterium]
MNDFNGFVFSKLDLIGSKSEGPKYYLQQFDYDEIPITKQAELWKEDPTLQKALGTKATISGEMHEGFLHYKKIVPYVPDKASMDVETGLIVTLKPEAEKLTLNKMPSVSVSSTPFNIALEVQWPFRSIWRGICPTSQIYDFFVEFDGKIVWQWSRDKVFSQVLKPVSISGGAPHVFAETWHVDPETITSEGVYTIRGLFIASNQEDEKQIEIVFVH